VLLRLAWPAASQRRPPGALLLPSQACLLLLQVLLLLAVLLLAVLLLRVLLLRVLLLGQQLLFLLLACWAGRLPLLPGLPAREPVALL
jgi:hypothetical protein